MGAPPGLKKKFAGVGLGLQKFAAAKKSTYDKRAVQAKQQALNAKKVNKYRRLLKKLGGANGEATGGGEAGEPSASRAEQAVRGEVQFAEAPGSAELHGNVTGKLSRKRKQQDEDDDAGKGGSPGAGAAGGKLKGKASRKGDRPERPKTSLERLAAKVAAEKEAQRQERKKADDEWAKTMAAKAAKEKSRKKAKSNYMKRTKSGQPVMKHRVDKILSQLQGGGK